MKSHPVDLDQVTARLLEASALPAPPRQPQRSPTPSGDEAKRLDYELHIKVETESYNKLVAGGGRPWYPFHLLNHVAKNHGEYREMLRFWDSKGWIVYMKQLERWERFCRWQRDNRGPLTVQLDFEREWAELMRSFLEDGEGISKYDTEEMRNDHFETVRRRRAWEHRLSVEDGVTGEDSKARFAAYVLAMKARLGHHGHGLSFQLDQDPSRQDKLTTWIEYLNYEYWSHDQFVRKAEQLQPRYDEALKALQDADVLLPGETLELISRFEHGFQLDREKRDAKNAIRVAEAEVLAAQEVLDTTGQSLHRQGQATALAQAKARLNKVTEAAKAVEKRYELISNFVSAKHPYEKAKGDAEQHKILLQWILDQIPLIEAEIAEATLGGVSSRKRTRETNDEETSKAASSPKRRKQHNRPSSEVRTPPTTRAAVTPIISDSEGQAKSGSGPLPKEAHEQDVKAIAKRRHLRTKPSSSGPPSDPPPLRRSARIQALDQLPSITSGPPKATQGTSKSTAGPTTRPKRKTGGEGLQKPQKGPQKGRPTASQSTSKPLAKPTAPRKRKAEGEGLQEPQRAQRKRRRRGS